MSNNRRSEQHEPEKGLRLSEVEKQKLLQSLDTFCQFQDSNSRPPRKHPRYRPTYPQATIEIWNDSHKTVRMQSLIYDLSKSGAGIAARTYIHSGTMVMIHLRTIDSELVTIKARTTRCEYFDRQFHRVGLVFEQHIDESLFVDAKQLGIEPPEEEKPKKEEDWKIPRTALIICSDTLEADATKMMLSGANISAECVSSIEEGTERIPTTLFDIVLISDTHNLVDVNAAIEAAESSGYVGPMIVFTDSATNEKEYCADPYVIRVIRKPVEAGPLLLALRELFDRCKLPAQDTAPIYSSLSPSQCPDDELDKYVAAVHDCATGLEGFLASDDYDSALQFCTSLFSSASGFGYQALSAIASEAMEALKAANSIGPASQKIKELIRTIERIETRLPPKSNAA